MKRMKGQDASSVGSQQKIRRFLLVVNRSVSVNRACGTYVDAYRRSGPGSSRGRPDVPVVV
jgi:hypothetical protein